MKHSIRSELVELYSQHAPLVNAAQLISPHAESLAELFYSEMLQVNEAKRFLDNTLVDERLHKSMRHWIIDLFVAKDSDNIDTYINKQIKVGEVHSRINVPLPLVSSGMRLLKREFIRLIMASGLSNDEQTKTLLIANDLLDLSAELINTSYFHGIVEDERQGQSMRMHMVGHHLALDCERLRASIFDWQRRLLGALYTNKQHTVREQLQFNNLDLNLWLEHKADLLFPDFREIDQLRGELINISEILETVTHHTGRPDEVLMERLNSTVNNTTWLLSSLAEHAMENENTRDTLTRLLNRRYLPKIIQSEIRISAKYNSPFAVMVLDLDHFKFINDSHGHEAGDAVLTQFGERILSIVRPSDYIFRYGGEEFLVITSNVDRSTAITLAEKMRSTVADRPFTINNTDLSITTSIGIAMHDGHPDYTHLIKRADTALYQAKNSGRNRCVIGQ